MQLTARTVFALGFGIAGLNGAALLAPALAAPAQKNFNGSWSVTLVTESGSCDPSYSSAVAIQDGAVRHIPGGGAPVSITGGVAPDGRINLGLRRSLASGDASGRLQATGGSGTWRVGMLGCQGRWTAQRRSTVTAQAD